MLELFTYFLKTSGLIVIFYLTYYLLLRKETFHTSNRWFLLFGLLTSTLLPLFYLKKIVFVMRPKITIDDLIALANHSASKSKITPNIETTDWVSIAAFGYMFIVFILLIKALININSIFKIVQHQSILRENGCSVIDLKKNIMPFSFFNYIVYNSSLYTENETKSILLHEKVHCQQKHSIDMLLVHLFTIVFWINPIIWLYKKAVIQNLEFIADNEAIQYLEDKKCYQMTLLKVVSHQNCLPITNHFYQSLIKKRIVMLNKNQSHRRNSWKYTLVIPMLIAYVFLFQIKVVAQEKVEKNTLHASKAIGFVTNKDATDEEMINDTKTAKELLGIDYKFSNVKRNNKSEIIAISIEYKTKEGKSGKTEINSDQPIDPIYFNADDKKIGFSEIGSENDVEDAISIKTEKEIKHKKHKDSSKNKEKNTQNSIIIINGQKYDDATLQELDPDYIEKIDVITDKETVKKYNEKGKNSAIIVTTKKIKDIDNITINDKPNIVTIENGDEVVIMNNNRIKIPSHPMVVFTENSPELVINGIPQSNPKAILEIIDLKKIKNIKALDENNQETSGSAIKKVIITTN